MSVLYKESPQAEMTTQGGLNLVSFQGRTRTQMLPQHLVSSKPLYRNQRCFRYLGCFIGGSQRVPVGKPVGVQFTLLRRLNRVLRKHVWEANEKLTPAFHQLKQLIYRVSSTVYQTVLMVTMG